MKVRKAGLRKKLCCMTLDDPAAVVMGSEPVMAGRKVLGFVTSADYGYSVGTGIAYAYLPVEYSEPGTKAECPILQRAVRRQGRRGVPVRPRGGENKGLNEYDSDRSEAGSRG